MIRSCSCSPASGVVAAWAPADDDNWPRCGGGQEADDPGGGRATVARATSRTGVRRLVGALALASLVGTARAGAVELPGVPAIFAGARARFEERNRLGKQVRKFQAEGKLAEAIAAAEG